MSATTTPRIVLATGEPAGIGPDLVVTLAQQSFAIDIMALGDPALLEARAQQLGLRLEIEIVSESAAPVTHQAGRLRVLPVGLRQPCRTGVLNPANARYVLEMLDRACAGCLNRSFAAMVTAPLHKGVINDAGIAFTGHTEYLAERCGEVTPVMLLATPNLRVALATTHVPLAEVSRSISKATIETILEILIRDLRERFGVTGPRVVVCGLNPHAGEGGYLGREEIDHIAPAIEAMRARGHDVLGPTPADTAFVARNLIGVDAVLAMYHDQGLPVLKHQGFGEAVNVTLGLPIIRTSVDHGTALDLAGTGRAAVGSLRAALLMAAFMTRRSVAAPSASRSPA